MPDPSNVCQLIADWYSQHGKEQVLVSIYRKEALLYLQVSEETMRVLNEALAFVPYMNKIGAARSADGMTYVVRYHRERTNKGTGDWLSVFMGTVTPVLVRHLTGILTNGNVLYTDRRWADANTVDMFASILRSVPPTPNVSSEEKPTK